MGPGVGGFERGGAGGDAPRSEFGGTPFKLVSMMPKPLKHVIGVIRKGNIVPRRII